MNNNDDITPYLPTIKFLAKVAFGSMKKPSIYSVQDLVSEASVLYYEKVLPSFRQGRNTEFKTYLITCVKNHFKSLIRKSYLQIDIAKIGKFKNMQKTTGFRYLDNENAFIRTLRNKDGIVYSQIQPDDYVENVELRDFIGSLDIVERHYVDLITQHGRAKTIKLMKITRFTETKIRKSIAHKWNKE